MDFAIGISGGSRGDIPMAGSRCRPITGGHILEVISFPCVWQSVTDEFQGSAWEYDKATDEFYLHLFATEQPDLNWDNPQVRKAVHQIMRFWLEKGVSGFRLDVINFISKDQSFPDAPVVKSGKPYQDGSMYYACGPRLHEYLQDLGRILKEYNAFSVGEMPSVYDPAEILKAVGFSRQELAMAFQFEIMDIDHASTGKFAPGGAFRLQHLKSVVTKWQSFMYENDGWNALYLENHDQGRSISRFASADPEYRALSGKMLATFLGFQSGTPFIYQGQEVGMVNIPESWDILRFKDIEAINFWNKLIQEHPRDSELHSRTLKELRLKSRDNGRLPMQWSAEKFAGFTSGSVLPWMDVSDDYATWNASSQVSDPDSVFQYWAKILRLRKDWVDVFVYGSFHLIDKGHKDLFIYSRCFGEMIALVVTNFSKACVDWVVPTEISSIVSKGTLLVGNYKNRKLGNGRQTTVQPFEAFVLLLDKSMDSLHKA
jgi:glycosidase